ncbi:hypothetical protein ABNM12_01900 [Pseudomonas syringae]|uniref:Uncharacterized protein n=6 Tax=Pseudomonas TaxID=286 RepID=A0AAJ4B232_PSESX|nr:MULTISPECIES: hypothetical protein [Pseudomonas]MCW6055919.1 hypothetical protein [Pseudomonas fragi]AKF44750.1 hypothetical protein PsyrB_06125 [Pseudomonas syringae pv. syringae B301D]EGH69225.1 hypothetical protein PSYAR_01519 [Pseudomonas syringae pv. aceris str. M302273]EXL30148.1 hypothetical protein PssB301D_03370 [Pseudomonas syringae pv. syringae str. B301D-R]KOG04990.1 Uncharacterized protein ABJ98_4361 [Pseudomonas syringae pv. aceris]
MPRSSEDVLSEEAIQELEAQIPAKASLATRMAYEKAKSSGQTVLLSKGGFIVAECADGTEEVVCASTPRRKVATGSFRIGPRSATSART